jgi:ATP-dependent Clp protease ATP-binding subunit ClpX
VKYAEPDDFRKMGLIQEIVGRLPVITYVNPLTRADLKRILIEPKNSIIKQYKKLFELSGKDLQISDEVYDYIVEKAFGTDTGARGLRNIVEKILKEPMFNSPSLPNKYDSKGRLVKGSNIIKINLDYVKEVESKNYIDPKKKEELEKRTLIK